MRLASLAASAAGAALLFIPAQTYSIARVDCPNWPSPEAGLPLQAIYLVAVALLTVGWLGLIRDRAQPLAPVLLGGLVVHLIALASPPFISQDPLFYAAIGRAIARHQDPYLVQLGQALPAGDPYLRALPDFWVHGTSAYSPGFHLVAAGVARLAGDDLWRALKLFQAIGLLSMLGAAWAAGRAAGDGRAAALVVFSPLAVIEGTVGAHNDALVALGAGLFALCLAKPRSAKSIAGAIASTVAGVAIKLSAVLLAAMYATTLAFDLARSKLRDRRVAYAAIGVAAIAAAVPAVLLLRRISPLFGAPGDVDACTSFAAECAFRFGLRMLLHLPTAAWVTGLAFRAGGLVLLIATAYRASRDREVLPWAAFLLFAYFLYFAGQSRGWYWLPMLPLLGFAHPRHLPAMLMVCVAAMVSYPVHLRFTCAEPQHLPMWQRIVGNTVEEVLLNVPTTALLVWGWRRRA
jgi:hypothetical protein